MHDIKFSINIMWNDYLSYFYVFTKEKLNYNKFCFFITSFMFLLSKKIHILKNAPVDKPSAISYSLGENQMVLFDVLTIMVTLTCGFVCCAGEALDKLQRECETGKVYH